jgi:Bacterial signalling protein N terminal repeat
MSTFGASLIMGIAISGMHYTGMAAMSVHAPSSASAPVPAGASASGFVFPLVAGVSVLMFVLALAIGLSPSETEIKVDAALSARLSRPPLRGAWPGVGRSAPVDRGGRTHWNEHR